MEKGKMIWRQNNFSSKTVFEEMIFQARIFLDENFPVITFQEMIFQRKLPEELVLHKNNFQGNIFEIIKNVKNLIHIYRHHRCIGNLVKR